MVEEEREPVDALCLPANDHKRCSKNPIRARTGGINGNYVVAMRPLSSVAMVPSDSIICVNYHREQTLELICVER